MKTYIKNPWNDWEIGEQALPVVYDWCPETNNIQKKEVLTKSISIYNDLKYHLDGIKKMMKLTFARFFEWSFMKHLLSHKCIYKYFI